MRRHVKRRLSNKPNRFGGAFRWFFVILAIGTLNWVWWNAANRYSRQPPHPGKAAHPPVKGSPPIRTMSLQRRTVSTDVLFSLPSATDAAVRLTNAVLEVQLALERQGISSGSLDGELGSQTRAAIRAFQRKEGLSETGELDAETQSRLRAAGPLFTTYTVTTNDLDRLRPLNPTWLGKSQQPALDYENVLEMVAEKSHAHPDLIRRLNPSVDWDHVAAGATLRVPAAGFTDAPRKAAFVIIRLQDKTLEAFDAETNLLAHFPCSIARRVEKRPIGELHVAVIVPDPNYTFDPALFPASSEAQHLSAKLVLPPGPNNPVGTVWIGLDKPGYGIHGTPHPEQVGRTESHGCFRLANWNAEYLLKLAWVGMPVYVEP